MNQDSELYKILSILLNMKFIAALLLIDFKWFIVFRDIALCRVEWLKWLKMIGSVMKKLAIFHTILTSTSEHVEFENLY